MEIHKPLEERKKAVLCELCGNTYSSSNRLKNHVKLVHEGVRAHVCNHCGVSFATSWLLKGHIFRRHDSSNAPGHPCTICGKVFRMLTDLKQHMKTKVHGGPGQNRGREGIRSRKNNVPAVEVANSAYLSENHIEDPPMVVEEMEVEVGIGTYAHNVEYGSIYRYMPNF